MSEQPTGPKHDDGQSSSFVSRQQYRQEQERAAQAVNGQESSPIMHRHEWADDHQAQEQEEKIQRLKRRLNIAIVALVAVIIVVYLILFYVG